MAKSLEHRWDVSFAEAREIQNSLRRRVRRRGRRGRIDYVAGVDISIRDNRAIAAVPVLCGLMI